MVYKNPKEWAKEKLELSRSLEMKGEIETDPFSRACTYEMAAHNATYRHCLVQLEDSRQWQRTWQ